MKLFKRRLLAGALAMVALAITPAYSQWPGQGDDTTTSLGSFKIAITTQFQPIVNGCAGYDPNTRVLTSPTLFDPSTIIGRSNVITDGSPADQQGVPVGTANTRVGEMMLTPPPQWPCLGLPAASCSSGPGTSEIHTEVRSLNLTPGGAKGALPAVRAGIDYPLPDHSPIKISPGEVESHSGPTGGPTFPASSFFDMFVKVDLPQCGQLPATTVLNQMPLIVKNSNLTAFPPKVVYLHDQSTIVPVIFLNGPFINQILGYMVLAGHGAGFGNSQSDLDQFNNFMSQQPVGTCPMNSCGPSGLGIAISPTSATTGPGGSANYTVTVNGPGPIALTESGLPSGSNANFVAHGNGVFTMIVAVSSSTPPGSYPFGVTASNGNTSASAAATLNVMAGAGR